jgi:hypothetical protein
MKYAVPRQRDWHVTLLVGSWGSEDTLKDRESREIRCMVTMLRSSTGIFGDIIFKEGNLDKQTLFRQIPTVECQGYFCGRNA